MKTPASSSQRHTSELSARRGLIVIVVVAMALVAAMVLATSVASL